MLLTESARTGSRQRHSSIVSSSLSRNGWITPSVSTLSVHVLSAIGIWRISWQRVSGITTGGVLATGSNFTMSSSMNGTSHSISTFRCSGRTLVSKTRSRPWERRIRASTRMACLRLSQRRGGGGLLRYRKRLSYNLCNGLGKAKGNGYHSPSHPPPRHRRCKVHNFPYTHALTNPSCRLGFMGLRNSASHSHMAHAHPPALDPTKSPQKPPHCSKVNQLILAHKPEMRLSWPYRA